MASVQLASLPSNAAIVNHVNLEIGGDGSIPQALDVGSAPVIRRIAVAIFVDVGQQGTERVRLEG